MPPRTIPDEWRILYGLMVLAITVLFFVQTRSVLSPLIVFLLLLYMLSPYIGSRRHVILVTSASVMLLFWLLDTLGTLLAPFLIAIGLAYILDPLADRIEQRGVPRSAAVALLLLPVLGVVVVLLVFGIPALIHQVESLLQQVPTAVQRIVDWLQTVRLRLAAAELPFIDADRLAAQLSEERIAAYVQQRQAQILASLWGAVLGVGRGFGVAITVIGYLVLTPVLLVYLLRDFNKLTARAESLVPEHKRGSWMSFLREYDRLLARFLRGQVLAAAIVGVLTWLGLWIVGFPYSGLVGAIAGVFNLVPYLGLIVSIIPVLLIALITGDFVVSILKAGAVFAVVQLIDGSVTGPRIVGGSVGLHPVWVILALAIGSFFLGFVGLLIAVPAAVGVKLLARESVARYRNSRVFRGTPAPDQTT